MTEKMLTRRDFLVSSTSFAAGAAVGSLLGGNLLIPAQAAEAPALPWPYKQLDPAAARKVGYELYFQGG